MILVGDIQRAVAEDYGVPVRVMQEPRPVGKCGRNAYSAAHPRQFAMALSFLLTDHSKGRIGHFFGGRDHTTVFHACKVVAKRLETDPEMRARQRRITLSLCQASLFHRCEMTAVADAAGSRA